MTKPLQSAKNLAVALCEKAKSVNKKEHAEIHVILSVRSKNRSAEAATPAKEKLRT